MSNQPAIAVQLCMFALTIAVALIITGAMQLGSSVGAVLAYFWWEALMWLMRRC